MEPLTIQEAAAFVGLSAHTLRYYERAGLLEPVARSAGGQRRYAPGDLDRLRFLHCLRETGMPIRRMQEYAALAREGRATLAARIDLLAAHRRDVRERADALQRALGIIDAKLARFEASRAASPAGRS